MQQKKKIFVSTIEIAGLYTNLAQGLRSIGLNAKTGFISQHRFVYENTDDRLLSQSLAQYFHSKFIAQSASVILKPFYALAHVLCASVFLIQSLIKYDVFIFGFSKTFLPKNIDLPLFKLFKKKVIFMFNGDDSRPDYLSGTFSEINVSKLIKKKRKLIKKKRKLCIITKNADVILEHPLCAHLQQKHCVFFQKVGVPTLQGGSLSSFPPKPMILHSPSNPKLKGTFLIREVIEELKNDGYQFDYVELINKTNAQVIENIKNCSFVVDQLYSDTPMAGFAAEAASFGKAAIVGGYELDKLKALLNNDEWAPSYTIEPDKEALKKAVIYLLENKDYCQNLGKEAYQFVTTKWSAENVAKNFMRIINDDIPEEWFFDPYKIDCIYGGGFEANERRSVIRKFVTKHGNSALLLDDKPDLRDKIVADAFKKIEP